MADIVMPKLSDSMEEGLVLEWLFGDGLPVSIGDELVEIETDKATMTVTSEVEGILEIVVHAGTTVAVGAVIARATSTPRLRASGGDGVAVAATAEQSAPAAAVNCVPQRSKAPRPVGAEAGDDVRATPVARRLAPRYGVALASVRGSGPGGRITKTDVLEAAGIEPGRQALPLPRRGHEPAREIEGEPATVEQLTRTQQLIADRMTEASGTIPHFEVQTEVAMDRAIALRDELRPVGSEHEQQPVPSLNDLNVKACALALRRHPRVNGSYLDRRFQLHERVNVGIAVAVEDALLVPTVFDADVKPLSQIAQETRRLAEDARSREISPADLSGATFTVSSLGMYGMTAIVPIINPPQAAILGVGKVRDVLARVEGGIVDRPLLTLTLSCDHRILYGADAARFLADVRALLESPLRLVL
jgi:pyruvate dehydrogenase E2 component (dihydrolipoamide acetyltransferase)